MPVFGKPVREGTRKERAIVAKKDPNAGGKYDDAIAYLNAEKDKWGNIATLCKFYNATGQPLVFDDHNSFVGHVYDTGYPPVVQNGQWGAFLYVPKTGSLPPGAIGYVVYSGTYIDTELCCKQLFAWNTPGDLHLSNSVYCDIFDDDVAIDTEVIYRKIEYINSSSCVVKKEGMLTSATTEERTTTPFYKAILTIEDTLLASKNSEGVEASAT